MKEINIEQATKISGGVSNIKFQYEPKKDLLFYYCNIESKVYQFIALSENRTQIDAACSNLGGNITYEYSMASNVSPKTLAQICNVLNGIHKRDREFDNYLCA